MNSLKEAVEEYLTMRRSLGFKLCNERTPLLDFVRFLEEQGVSYVTTRLALEWAQKPASASPQRWARRLSFVRCFARFRSATDNRTEIPPYSLLPFQPRRGRPYIYSDQQILQLLEAVLTLPRLNGFERRTYYCVYGLLAVCGMRIGEVLCLKMRNIDLCAGVLTLEGSKFGKSRLVPLHISTQKILADYIALRNETLNGIPAEQVFVSTDGNRINSGPIRRAFYTLCQQMGLREKNAKRGPRLHDLRHTFAIKSLLQWYQTGENVDERLPVLSTFLGHVRVADTYWYLTACPELMGTAVKRLEHWWEVKS
ncbi:MAG: tyrosine-type recombinase/integrase [Nitrososphaerales archaeon]